MLKGLFAISVMAVVAAHAQLRPLQQKVSTGGGLSTLSAAQTGIPSEAEISAFKTESDNPSKPAEKLVLVANLAVQKMTPDMRKKYTFNGRVPYRLTVELLRSSAAGGRATRVLEGSCNIVLVDASGAVLKRTKESMANLCPS